MEVITIFASLSGFLVLLKLFCWVTMGKCKSKRRMEGKIVIITGANSGLGKETTRDLARRGAKVIMACRNLDLANKVRDEIIEETQNRNITVEKLDLGDFDSVREFANRINLTLPKIDVLIHNAGIYLGDKKSVNKNGIELTFATNHLGPFLLTHLLIDKLKSSAPCRIVIVSSGLFLFSFTNFEHFHHSSRIGKNSAYNYIISKHGNNLFMRELSSRLKGTNISVNAVDPGPVQTNISANANLFIKFLFKIFKTYRKTAEEGAQTQIYLAVDENIANVTGKYFSDCRPWNFVSTSESECRNAKILWNKCEEWVNLKENEKIPLVN